MAVDTANQMDGLGGLDGWLFTSPKGFLLLFAQVAEHRDWPLAEPLRHRRALISAINADILSEVKHTCLLQVAFLADRKATLAPPFCRAAAFFSAHL